MLKSIFPLTLLALGAALSAQDGALTVFTPCDNQAELTNPDMGWTLYQYSNDRGNYGMKVAADDLLSDFPGLSTVYMRLAWGDIEPEAGSFYWSYFDTPTRKYAQSGKKIALRLTSTESFGRDGTPPWVQALGVKGTRFTHGVGESATGERWEPDYDNPIFLAELEKFVARLAERYDGSDEVSFIDIGSFGIWGEGHTWVGSSREFSDAVIKQHIDLYAKYFKKTPILGNIGFLDRKGAVRPEKKGNVATHFTMLIPKAFEGKRYEMRIILNNPYAGNYRPANANADNSVTIGILSVSADGVPTVEKNPEALIPGQLTEHYAAELIALEYDRARFRYSCRIHVRYLYQEPQMPHITTALVLADVDTGTVVNAIGESKFSDGLVQYMVDQKIGFRDDSVMVSPLAASFTGAYVDDNFWRTRPVVLEMAHYDHILSNNAWQDGGDELWRAVQDAHASQLGVHFWPREFLEQNRELVRRVNLVIGYRYNLEELAVKITMQGPFTGRMRWRNVGVAPCYNELYPTLTLKDKAGNLIGSFTAEDVRLDQLMPNESREFEFSFPCFEFYHPGTQWDLFVSAGSRLGRPLIELPLDNPDGDRRYRIGAITVE